VGPNITGLISSNTKLFLKTPSKQTQQETNINLHVLDVGVEKFEIAVVLL
jgi:hypothetical protein